jgi:outer membrane protein TolC
MVKRTAGILILGIIINLLLATGFSYAQGDYYVSSLAEKLSLKQCLEIASRKNQDIEMARSVTAEREAERLSAKGRFGPLVRLEANTASWDSPFGLAVDLPLPGMTTTPEIQIRDKNTTQYSATIVQPITGLWTAYAGYKAQASAQKASQFQEKATKNDVIVAVTDAYIQALEAQRMVSIAEAGFKVIEAHTAKARRFFENKLIARNDVLEAEVRKAEAKGQLIQAEGGAKLARANLAYQIGLPSDKEIWPEELDIKLLPDNTAPSYGPEQRPELAVIRSRIEQADAGESAARSRMLPEINAFFKWQGSEGLYIEPDKAWMGGVMLSWNIWDWGSTYYDLDAAQARVLQAKSAQIKAKEGMRLEILQTKVELDTSRTQLDVASGAVAQAEMNLESVQRRFEVQSIGSTEVLDAQTLLDRVRFNEARAKYSVSRAYVKLRRAQGLDPVPSEGSDAP